MPSTDAPRRRGTRLAASFVVVVGVALAWTDGTMAASTFTASAGGEIARSVIRLEPPVLQEELVDPGALAAQASLTSFGESTAFASTPYPGTFVLTIPGLADGILSTTPGIPPELLDVANLPDYPLIATSSFPVTPSATVGAGPLVLTADSSERDSTGVVTDGVNRTQATVSVDEADRVTARAVSEVGVVDMGPLIQLGGVRSEATAVRTTDGQLDRSSAFSVASLIVLGQQLRITPDGLELSGVNLPGGLGAAHDPVEQLLASLAAEGVTIELLEASETPDGVVSAGLVLRRTFNTGLNGIIATVTTTIGRTFADVSNRALPPIGDESATAGTTPSDGAGASATPVGGAAPARPSGSATAPRGAAAGVDQVITALVPEQTDGGRFYPALVLGGAVLVVGTSFFRRIGVRTAWTS